MNEWQAYPMNYCENLGTLSSEEIKTKQQTEYTLYPNPVTEGLLHVKGEELSKIKTVKIFDAHLGMVKEISQPFQQNNQLEVNDLKTGLYWLLIEGKAIKFIKK